MKRSNFEKVVDFNTQFGVLSSTILKPNPTILVTDPNTVEFCLKLIREEVKELEQAVKDKDYVEVVDALADILYVTYGMSARIGIDMDEAFRLVHENNMSKLCSTEGEAQRSVEYYKNNYEKFGYDSPNYRRAPGNRGGEKEDSSSLWVVYNESTKKILKSIEWKPVDLTGVCK